MLSTFIKLPFVIKIFFYLFLSGCFTQVLLYNGIGRSEDILFNYLTYGQRIRMSIHKRNLLVLLSTDNTIFL